MTLVLYHASAMDLNLTTFFAIGNQWWTYIHLIGVFGFLVTHGVSMAVALRLRRERDRERIRQLLQLSGETIMAMYISLLVLLAGGIMAAVKIGFWSSQSWPKAALGLTIAMIAVMSMLARPYYRGIKEACALRPSGAPRVSDEDLATRLRSWQPLAIIWSGFGSLAILLYMMVFKWPR